MTGHWGPICKPSGIVDLKISVHHLDLGFEVQYFTCKTWLQCRLVPQQHLIDGPGTVFLVARELKMIYFKHFLLPAEWAPVIALFSVWFSPVYLSFPPTQRNPKDNQKNIVSWCNILAASWAGEISKPKFSFNERQVKWGVGKMKHLVIIYATSWSTYSI